MQKREAQFRPSTMSERNIFYSNDFSIGKLRNWFIGNKIPLPQICAIDAGTETGIIVDKKLRGTMLYCSFD